MQLFVTFFKELRRRFKALLSKPNINLLLELIRANFKLVDYNSILGISWSFIGPVALLAILYFIFNYNFGRSINAYPLYLLTGIISVNFFIAVTTYMIRIFSINRDIICNSTIPRETLLISNLYVHVHKFVIELGVCLIISILYGFFSWAGILLLIPLVISYVALAFGVGLILSLCYCFVRDIEHLWMLISRLLFFATPVFYNINNISVWAKKLVYWMNPLTFFLLSFRNIIMPESKFDINTYAYSIITGCIVFLAAYCIYVIFEKMAVEHV